MIKQRPIFGTGHSGVNLSPKFHISDYDVTDLPLLGHLMQYGFLGIFIYIFYYFKIFKVMKELYFAIKRKEKLEIVQKYRFEFIFSICSIVFFTAYFIRIYGCFIELSNYWDKIETTIYVAILLACLQKFKRDKILNNQQESYSRKEDMILENVKSNNNLHPEG
ncbi:MAG: hypothetical protein HY738_18035 [Bacteroidia bacterium]|nr:hypothetical protein [Bacteroidia bacterium]